jgi:HD-GYP domain-containing protein (c-di-GMP phosphodiesterase class II)
LAPSKADYRFVRLIPTRKIRDGVELARDIINGPPGTAPLLRRGVRLSARYATLLPKAGVGSVWIEDELGADIDVNEPLTPETREKVHKTTATAIAAANGALRSGSGMPHTVVESLTDVAASMVQDLLDCPEAALALDDLNAFDDYTHRHSVQVTLLGLLIARRAWKSDGWTDFRGRRRMDRIDDRMRKLGLGLLVHDVGKLAVPPEVLNKPGRLTAEEFEVMKGHPVAGVELLRPADMSPLSLSVVRDHHERIDGSGYPEKLSGSQIQEFPRIAAVADVYDSVTSERVYKDAAPPHVGVKVIRDGSGSQFCPNVVRHFRAVVMPYPIGHEIELPDGRSAVVSAVSPDDPDSPTVRVRTGSTIDEFRVDMTADAAVA